VTYKINILENANNDLNHLRRNDKNSYVKVFDLVREIMFLLGLVQVNLKD